MQGIPQGALYQISSYYYLLLLFSVVVFHMSMDNWRTGALVYVHSAICETSVV